MNEKQDDQFTNLADFRSSSSSRPTLRGNVIKARTVVKTGAEKVTVEDGNHGQPNVIVHRQGEVITSMEIICTCGKSTMVEFDYGGE